MEKMHMYKHGWGGPGMEAPCQGSQQGGPAVMQPNVPGPKTDLKKEDKSK